MTAYIARRFLAVLPVMAVVALFVFFLLRLAPGDPAAIIAGDDATAESIAAVRARLGLDRRLAARVLRGIHYEQSVGPHQPTTPMQSCASGTRMNCPREPPAPMMPFATERFASGIQRAMADASCAGPAKRWKTRSSR